MRKQTFFASTLAIAMGLVTAAAADPVQSIGDASAAVTWTGSGAHLSAFKFIDRMGGRTLDIPAPFAITLGDRVLTPAELSLAGPVTEQTRPGDPKASRLSETTVRREVRAAFTDADGRLRIDWQLVQPENAQYVREVVTVTALKQDEQVSRIALLQARASGAVVDGKVKGSPVVAGNDYLMIENPLADAEAHIESDMVSLWLDNALPLRKGMSLTVSAVIGTTAPGQLRRDFLSYLEAERAHPYRTFLHYNSWYDIGYFNPYSEADALDRIHAFGEELSVKRGVRISSFMFDDGWDDRTGKWGFSAAFPHGFLPLKVAAARYGAAPGVWLSPWGGYGDPKQQRVAGGKAAGFEVIDGGFALSGPAYYDAFHKATLSLVTQQGVNQFKVDGTGNADKVFPGSRFNSDFDAAIHLVADLRAAKPDVFMNITTGTYPSPAWLIYADSIWRGGEDHAFAGVGTPRQRWMTYRDQQTYENIVIGGPLFPLNALMLHGLIYAQHAEKLDRDPGHDFPAEVHSYFGSGTALQEMYITPSLLTSDDWDVLAEAANWSRANADVLRDTHWIGGDPGRLDIYGWAAWSPRKAIITLRNPSDRPQSFALDIGSALELPSGSARTFIAHSPWKADAAQPSTTLVAGQPATLTLKPFEVLNLELSPR